MKRLMAITMFLIFVVACATEDQRAKTETAAIGAAGGAGLGAIGAKIFGKKDEDDKKVLQAAAIGGAIGGIAGYMYADSITKRKQELSGKENDLDARINYARAVNEETHKANQELDQRIETLVAEMDELTEKAKQQESAHKELIAKQQDLEKEIHVAENNEAILQKELDEFKGFRANQSQSSDELDAEIAKLEDNLARLKNSITKMAKQRHRT
jgi:outer membrane lipoprotein SlyB